MEFSLDRIRQGEMGLVMIKSKCKLRKYTVEIVKIDLYHLPWGGPGGGQYWHVLWLMHLTPTKPASLVVERQAPQCAQARKSVS